MSGLEDYSALLLNADYRPLSTYPLSKMHWTKSVQSAISGKTIVVAEYDRHVRSGRMSMPIPAVMALREYVDLSRPAPLNKMNLFLRDRLHCVYCGEKFESTELTFDHVVPRSKGGRSTWLNLASACRPCNARKADRRADQVGMVLRRKPYHPTLAQLNALGTVMGDFLEVPVTWRDWLYWTTSIDP